jgi:hypothetical protein
MAPRASVDAFQQRNVGCLYIQSDWQAHTVLILFLSEGEG